MIATQPAFSVYVPIVSTPKARKGVGLTTGNVVLTDVDALGCDWYYTWGAGDLSDPRFVPMDFTGNENILPAGYNNYVMLFNEPEGQGAITPMQGVIRYSNFIKRYPKAKVILGNISLWGTTWIMEFIHLLTQQRLPRPHGWGIHGYTEGVITADNVIDFWEWFRDTIQARGEELWITELGDVQGRPEALEVLLEWARDNAQRYAVFANRIDDDAAWYPAQWPHPSRMHLITQAGGLTALGEWYRGW